MSRGRLTGVQSSFLAESVKQIEEAHLRELWVQRQEFLDEMQKEESVGKES